MRPQQQPPLQVNASLLFADEGNSGHAPQQQEPPKACMMAVHAKRHEAVEFAMQRRLAELEQGAKIAQLQVRLALQLNLHEQSGDHGQKTEVSSLLRIL